MNKSGSASKTTKEGEIPRRVDLYESEHGQQYPEARSRERSSLTAGLVAPAVALAVVGSLLYAQPMIRTYWWIASALFR